MRSASILLLLAAQCAAGAFAQNADPPHFRFQRQISLPSRASGQACVALDADTFAHTASTSAGDIRLYGRFVNAKTDVEKEIPFALTESGPSSPESQDAAVQNVAAHSNVLSFDLAMPSREYTEVDLTLHLKNFLAAVVVSGSSNRGGSTALGTYAVFDFSGQGLARSTALSLPSSTFPVLHVELRLVDLAGHPIPAEPGQLGGAMVPPSRQSQTVYTTVASTESISQQGHSSVASLRVSAHVPIERTLFILRPGFSGNFLRSATITASPIAKGWDAIGAAEGVSGDIFRVTHAGLPGLIPPIHSSDLFLTTTIGSNLQAPARVSANVDNGDAAPLPLERVELQMRQRRICFEARPAVSYTLRYGNPDLDAPSYGYMRRFVAAALPIDAQLEPEQLNPPFHSKSSGRSKQPPEAGAGWVFLLVLLVVGGVTALQYIRHKQEDAL